MTDENVNLSWIYAADAKFAAARAEERVYLEQQRPFMLLQSNIKVSVDGSKWCCLFGETVQDGVAGFGNTPNEASIDFDVQWLNKSLSPTIPSEKERL